MKRTLVTILFALSLTTIGLTGCGKTENTETEATEAELEVVDTETESAPVAIDWESRANALDQVAIADEEIGDMSWVELGSLTTYESLREDWNSILGVTGTPGNREGILYQEWLSPSLNSNDVTLAIFLEYDRFTDFVEFCAEEDHYKALVDAVRENFVDCENLTDKQCFSVGLNAYFNLLPMADESVSHGDEYVSRAQMLSILNRAEYSVDQKSSVYETDDLEAIVGESIYNESAAKEVTVSSSSPSYLPTDDGSLNAETYHAAVSRGEAIYSVFMSVYYCEGAMLMADLDSAELTDATNGGDIQSEQNLSSKAEALNYALRHPDQGCPEDIYKALVRANEIGAISDETTWEEAITLSDLISLYYDIAVYRFVSSKSGTTRAIEESEGWPEYKETMEYYVSNGIINESNAYMLNPDIYGTVTYGKGTADFDTGLYSGTKCKNLAVYVKSLDLKTTKGYGIEALYYVETGTVQFIYCGEVTLSGIWFLDEDSFDPILEAIGPDGGGLDLTHQQKIDLLGEPSMTAEEVIDEITNGTADYVKRLVLETTKGYLIQACWNMNDNTVEYIYPGDDTQYEWYRGSFVETSDALALAGKYKGTREEKIEVVGEPSLSPEEVIEALQEKENH